MRVPLDYYRILGLPIQATAEQLRQAHRDRTLQLPRREYSEAAIMARKQLLDEAYAVLSIPEERQAYDTTFLAKSYELEAELASSALEAAPSLAVESPLDPYTPSIEIEDSQLVGALLILLELGEYELVLRLGRPYLSSGSRSLTNQSSTIVLADVVLTIALACLELGREQWQQGQYENAAESLQTGQDLLLQEGVFPMIRGEMQADLYKLRPYRILELLAQSSDHQAERRRGIALLKDMLQDRGGIDGAGDDQSGLNVDDFLRFIQQLRSYLTVAEQQTLFEAEARRPSAVAMYLAVYSLLARGFTEEQPALIRRSKLMLMRLGSRQDVHLEQAICALLLGQTEEASRALELSQEYDSIAFIREHSQGSPDLLPGLCLYAEQWLQNEVFPQFQDLAERRASLKDYFANEQVQAYLEELPNEPEASPQWNQVPSSVMANGHSPGSYSASYTPLSREAGSDRVSTGSKTATATLEAEAPATQTAVPTAQRVSSLSPDEQVNGGASMPTGGGQSGRSPYPATTARRPSGLGSLRTGTRSGPPYRGGRRRSLRLDRLMFLLAIGVLGIGSLIYIGNQLTRASAPEGDPSQSIQRGLADSINTAAQPFQPAPTPSGELTQETAQQVIDTWLAAKAAAFGETHDLDKLADILVDPALSRWRAAAQDVIQANEYREYEHTVNVISVAVSPSETETTETAVDQGDEAESDLEDPTLSAADASPSPGSDAANPAEPSQTTVVPLEQTAEPVFAEVVAEVTENATVYRAGADQAGAPETSNLEVQYSLIRQDGRWYIQDWSYTQL